jgi:hypothetical protein
VDSLLYATPEDHGHWTFNLQVPKAAATTKSSSIRDSQLMRQRAISNAMATSNTALRAVVQPTGHFGGFWSERRDRSQGVDHVARRWLPHLPSHFICGPWLYRTEE